MSTSTTPSSTETVRRRRYGYAAGPAQCAAVVAGIFLLVLGIGGFIPGVTKDLETLAFAGPGSKALLFGALQTSVLQNVVTIILGLIGLGSAGKRIPSTLYLLGVGSIYLVVFAYGAASGNIDNFWNFLPSNTADNALRVCIGFAFIIAAAATSQLAMKGSRYDEG